MLYLGCFFLWGNISVYVLSYFHYYNPDASFSFVFLVDMFLVLFNLTGYQVGTFLFKVRGWHPKIVLAIGAVLSLLGNFLSSYTTTIAPYLACYTLMNGIGCGMCYMVPLICGWEHLPSKRGLVTGICLGGYGFGSFIFSQVSSALVNPDKTPVIDDPSQEVNFYPADVADNVPFMIRNLVYIWIGLVVVSVPMISRPAKTEVAEFAVVSEDYGDDIDAEKINKTETTAPLVDKSSDLHLQDDALV